MCGKAGELRAGSYEASRCSKHVNVDVCADVQHKLVHGHVHGNRNTLCTEFIRICSPQRCQALGSMTKGFALRPERKCMENVNYDNITTLCYRFHVLTYVVTYNHCHIFVTSRHLSRNQLRPQCIYLNYFYFTHRLRSPCN